MFSKHDEIILTDLARQVKNASLDPVNDEKREFWYRHTSLKGERPAVFVHPDGSWNEFVPFDAMECETWYSKYLEMTMRRTLFRHKYIPDDVPIEGKLDIDKVFTNTWWGIEPKRKTLSSPWASWHHEPIIENPSDWEKLSMPVVEYDDAQTSKRWEYMQNLLGDILALELTGVKYFNFHITHYYCDFRGLENLYTDFILDPDTVHRQMRFFADGMKSMFLRFEELGLVSLNNDGAFHYTGGVGYNRELPQREGFDPNHVRLCDVWGAAEAQELDPVSPQMHEEFVLSYEREVLSLFGLNGYGCCDNLAKKLDNVLKIKNLRRVAVCPWADISDFVPELKDNYIMTWKPQPAFLAYENLPVDEISAELTSGVKKALGGKLELILRDTHTVRREPERFGKWIEIARQAIRSSYGEV